MDYIKNYFEKYKEGIDKINLRELDEIVNVLFRAWKHGGSIFIIGNGGSASTASHMAADIGKNTLENPGNLNSKRVRVTSLTDNVASMTALGNDLSYGDIFSQQLITLAKPADVLIAVSGSGNSPNVIKAIEVGNDIGMVTVGLLGFQGGKAKDILDHKVIFEEGHYGRIEDFHLMANHIIVDRMRELIGSVYENENN